MCETKPVRRTWVRMKQFVEDNDSCCIPLFVSNHKKKRKRKEESTLFILHLILILLNYIEYIEVWFWKSSKKIMMMPFTIHRKNRSLDFKCVIVSTQYWFNVIPPMCIPLFRFMHQSRKNRRNRLCFLDKKTTKKQQKQNKKAQT